MRKKNRWLRSAGVLSLAAGFWLAAVPAVRPLPSFRNMFEAKAGYGASCQSCHQPRDWRLTPYAKEYVRLKKGRAALDALDVMDPDRDGYPSKVEIEYKSNPGDRRSTPDHPGPWLAERTPPGELRETFLSIFGSSVTVQVVEKRLAPEQTAAVEQALNQKLSDEEEHTSELQSLTGI